MVKFLLDQNVEHERADEDMASLAAIAGAGVFASLALMLALMRPKKREEEEAAE